MTNSSDNSRINAAPQVEGASSIQTRVRRKKESDLPRRRRRQARKGSVEEMLEQEQEHIEQSPDDHIDYRA